MSSELEGRNAIVTGAGRGIGRATALALSGMGAGVMVADMGRDERGAATAEGVAEEIREAGGRALSATGSVTDDALVQEVRGPVHEGPYPELECLLDAEPITQRLLDCLAGLVRRRVLDQHIARWCKPAQRTLLGVRWDIADRAVRAEHFQMYLLHQ